MIITFLWYEDKIQILPTETELFQDIESLSHELGVLRGKEDTRELELLEVGSAGTMTKTKQTQTKNTIVWGKEDIHELELLKVDFHCVLRIRLKSASSI